MTAASHVSFTNPIPGEEELVARARAMIPMLFKLAGEVEKARRVPDSTVAAFKEAGFFHILQPKRWGGWEMKPQVFYKVLMELARGCPSSAWVMMALGVHQWEFGLFPQQAGNDVWAKDRTVLIASSYAPVGKSERVDGGWRISGRWPASSGTDHANWAILGGLKMQDGKPIDRLAMLVPRESYTIDDDWYVFGLCGTGSKSLIVKDTFVPDHRTHSLLDTQRTGNAAPCYKPQFTLVFWGAVSSVINGMAQGAVDIFTDLMKTRINAATGVATNTNPYVRDRLANAVAKVRSSRMRLLSVMNNALEHALRGNAVPMDEFVPAVLDITRVGHECEEAVLLLYKATAAQGLFLNTPLQRILRDALAGANHITQNADDMAGNLGGYLLGQPLPPLVYGR